MLIGIFEVINIESKNNYRKYIIKVKYIEILKYENNYYKKIHNKICKNTKLIFYSSSNINLFPGDIVKINGKFQKANTSRNKSGFDYRKYLKQHKIYGILESEKVEKIKNEININSVIQNIRLNISDKIYFLYENQNTELLNGILIGKKDVISREVLENFNNSNISHILSISGLHISYVVIGTEIILKFIIKNRKLREKIIIFILIFYTIFTGFSVSCIRACIMQICIIIASLLHRKSNFYRSLFISFVIIIFFNPFNIFNIGLWFSYLGILGIRLYYNLFLKISQKYLKKSKFKNMIINFLKIVLITISAQILIFPIMFFEFGYISYTFLISNLLISFLIGPILLLGYISIILSFLKISFYNYFVYIENILLFCILRISNFFGNDKFIFYIKKPRIIFIILYYFFIVLSIYKFKKRKYYYIKCMISIKFLKKHLIKNKSYIKIVSIILMICIFFSNIKLSSKYLEIHFLDVGQGDCTFVKSTSGKNILIDGGEGNEINKFDYGKNVVLPYLLNNRITKLDYIVISHFDNDHVRRNIVYYR